MSFKEIILGDVIHIKHGYAFKSAFFSNKGEKILLTPGNFHEDGGFRLRLEKDRYFVGDIPEDYVLHENDLIVAMTEQGEGLLGSSAWIPESDKYLHNQRLGLIDHINEGILKKKYLYYLFNTTSVRGQIRGSASGTKVRHTSPERIYKVKVEIPSILSQEKITGVIDKYNYLIENNRRRIQLLEDSARLLYREWFVHLRFPGHEHVKIVEGVPEGWQSKKLGEVLTLNYGKALNADARVPGAYPVYGSSGVVGTHEKALVTGPGIILGRKGNVGSVYWSSKDFYPIDTVYFINAEQSNLYLYFALQYMQFINTDVAVPGLNRDMAYSRYLLIPPETILQSFITQATTIRQQIEKLAEYNAKLVEARDLLLPRLMSGAISV